MGSIAEQAGEATADRGYSIRLTALFGVGWLVLTADVMILNPLLPLIREEFQLSGTQAGLVTTAFYLPYLLMQVPGGLFADRFGPKQVLVVMTLVAGLALGGVGLLGFSMIALVVYAAVHRAGAGVYYSSAFGITLNAVPRAWRGVSSAALSGGIPPTQEVMDHLTAHQLSLERRGPFVADPPNRLPPRQHRARNRGLPAPRG